ncbi:MAG: hypothetical protein QW265_05710 [Candidatus Bathyarchaeia archaeon]
MIWSDKNSRVEEAIELVKKVLLGVPGVMEVHRLDKKHFREILRLETLVERSMVGIRGFNEGLREVLSRQVVLAIAHLPNLRHPPEPIILWKVGKEVVGEEVWEDKKIEELKKDLNIIFLGKNFVLYKDKLTRLHKADSMLVYPPVRFPELEKIESIKDPVSVTVSTPADVYIKKEMGWNVNDPKIGTVLIGFNIE